MSFIRKLVGVLCLALFCFSHSNAQQIDSATGQVQLTPGETYSTGNLVNQAGWQGAVNVQQLCFVAGDQGNCGPAPSYRPDSGNINFSYGLSSITQIQNIANAISYTGTGLQVNGFNFGFDAKNGNGWDDGRTDTLYAFTYFKDSAGNVVENFNWDLNYKFSWTPFNYNETFTTPYAVSSLSTVTYGFTGKDNNFWAGNYGPEIQNVNFSLKYSVDPCASNIFYSPSCPGYLDALAALTPTTTSTSPITQTTSTGTQIIEPTTQTVLTPVTNTAASEPAPTTEVNTTVTVTPTATTTTAAVSTAAVSTTPSVTATPTANNPQPKVGEIASPSPSVTKSTSPISTSQILNIISKEQNILSALESNTVSQTTQQANAIASSVTQQAEAVAGQAQSQSITASIQAGQSAEANAISSVKNNNGTTVLINAQSVVTASIAASLRSGRTPTQMNNGVPQVQSTSNSTQETQPRTTSNSTQETQPQTIANNTQETQPQTIANNTQETQSQITVIIDQETQPRTTSNSTQETQSQITVIIDQETQPQTIANNTQETQPLTTTNNTQETQPLTTTNNTQETRSQGGNNTGAGNQTEQMAVPQQVRPINKQTRQIVPTVNVTSTFDSTQYALIPPELQVSNNGAGIVLPSTPPALSTPVQQSTPAPVHQPQNNTATSFQQNNIEDVVNVTGLVFRNVIQEQNLPVLYKEIEQQEKRMGEVKKNVKDNDAAGSVTLASMQTTPIGFELYTMGMTDAKFYAPKEIYKGQKNVDNARLLRGLSGGSDALHQRIVDQQYNR